MPCELGFDNRRKEGGLYTGEDHENYWLGLQERLSSEDTTPNIGYHTKGKFLVIASGGKVRDISDMVDSIDVRPENEGLVECIGHDYIPDSFICKGCKFYREQSESA